MIYSPDQPQHLLIITRNAYFKEDYNSALCFDSEPFAGAVPICSHFNRNGLHNTEENSEPSTYHQTGSAANLGQPPSTFIDEAPSPPLLATIPETTDDDQSDQLTLLPTGINPNFDEHDPTIPNQHGPTPPTPHHVNLAHHHYRHSILQKLITIYFQECNEDLPTMDPINSAMMTVGNTLPNPHTNPMDSVEKYLPEPQSPKAVLKLDDNVRTAWLQAICMEIKNLINHRTFILGKTPHKNELIIPVKLVLKAKPTATGKLDKLKARVVARGELEKRRIKKAKAAHQQHILQLCQDIAEGSPSDKPNSQPVDIPQPSEDTWSPCASSRGVKLLISTTCATCRTLKSANFIGAYLQAKVIGRHFVI